jgi:DNA (cytosine-5)-methyltransferase 1
LFAGIGGLDLGLERAGMQCTWQVELNDYARRVLAKHWPDVARHRDVRECGGHNLTPVDLICGGFPCQNISDAGHKAGIGGEQSGLWAEYARIICELRPRYVLVENVAALIDRGIDRVLSDLAASGYDAEWEVLPACAFGAPHTRERLFIVAYANREHEQAWVGVLKDWPTTLQGGHAGEGAKHWQSQPRLDRVADGIPRRVDRLRGLGNAVVPQIAEFIGRQIVAREGMNQ